MIGHRLAFRFTLLALGLALTCGTSSLRAQIINGHQWPTPRLSVLTPAGAKAGTIVDVGFTGTEVEEPTALLFNHPGIKGLPIIPELPKPDPKAKPDPKKKAPVRPPITKFTVTIAKDVPIGTYDARLVNKHGVSNPRRFVVGDLNEVAEKEPNNDVEQAQKIEIGSTITGNIATATDVDYYTFPGKKGQRVSSICADREHRQQARPGNPRSRPEWARHRLLPPTAATGRLRRCQPHRGRRLPRAPQ